MEDNNLTEIESPTLSYNQPKQIQTYQQQSVVKRNSEENESETSTSSGGSSESSSEDEDEDVSVSNKNKSLQAHSSTYLEHRMNNVLVPNHEPTNFGNIRVEKSDRVHMGSRTFYKGPVTVNQYLYNNSTLVRENNDSNFDESRKSDVEDNVGITSVNLDTGNTEKDVQSDVKFCAIIPLITKAWIKIKSHKKISLVVVVVVIFIISLSMWLLNNSNSEAHSTIVIPPPPIGPLKIEQLNATTVMVTWGVPECDNCGPLEIFKIDKKIKNEDSWIEMKRVNASDNSTIITGLLENHEYYFRVFAKNEIGFSKPLESESPFLIEPWIEVPSPPREPLNIRQISENDVLLNWTKSEFEGKAPIQRFKIEVKDAKTNVWSNESYVHADFQNFTVKNLEVDHEYFFRIFANNKFGFSKPLVSEKPFLITEFPAGDPEIVSRNDWEAKSPEFPPKKLETLPASNVIICSTRIGYCDNKPSCISQVQIEQRNSLKLGFGDIKYNFVIGGDGLIYEGRNWDIEGNHTNTYNNKSIGIGFLGEYMYDDPTDKQMDNLKRLLQYGLDNDKLDKNYKLLNQEQITNNNESPGYGISRIIKTWKHWSPKP